MRRSPACGPKASSTAIPTAASGRSCPTSSSSATCTRSGSASSTSRSTRPFRSGTVHERQRLVELRDDWQAMAADDDAIEPDPDFVLLDESFHVGLAESAGNPAIVEMLRTVNERIRIVRMQDFLTERAHRPDDRAAPRDRRRPARPGPHLGPGRSSTATCASPSTWSRNGPCRPCSRMIRSGRESPMSDTPDPIIDAGRAVAARGPAHDEAVRRPRRQRRCRADGRAGGGPRRPRRERRRQVDADEADLRHLPARRGRDPRRRGRDRDHLAGRRTVRRHRHGVPGPPPGAGVHGHREHLARPRPEGSEPRPRGPGTDRSSRPRNASASPSTPTPSCATCRSASASGSRSSRC